MKKEYINNFMMNRIGGFAFDVMIVAGCGIHNSGELKSEHNGIHSFHIGKKAKVIYIEKHYGEGKGKGKKILNPVTEVNLKEGSYLEMESVQIKGVDSTIFEKQVGILVPHPSKYPLNTPKIPSLYVLQKLKYFFPSWFCP